MEWTSENVKHLNSLTKFPSIFQPWAAVKEGKRPHFIGDLLTSELSQQVFTVTEKIDGVNARIVFTEDGWFLGGRNELLCYSGDVLSWEQNHILEVVRPVAERLTAGLVPAQSVLFQHPGVFAVFGEVYGGGIQKRYRGQERRFRIFAARWCPWDVSPNPQIWRQTSDGFGGESIFPGYHEGNVAQRFAEDYGLESVPILDTVACDFLTDPRAAYAWLKQFAASRVVDGAQCEGVVLLGRGDYTKADDGSLQRNIYKIKFEDFPRDW